MLFIPPPHNIPSSQTLPHSLPSPAHRHEYIHILHVTHNHIHNGRPTSPSVSAPPRAWPLQSLGCLLTSKAVPRWQNGLVPTRTLHLHHALTHHDHIPLTLHASSLRLGTIAPNFKAETTKGPIDLHEYIGDNWLVFFSHPEDFTPVCTTELGEMARLEPQFTQRGVKLLGLSANTVDSHEGWAADIKEISGNTLNFPIVADKERKVAFSYDMYVVSSLSKP